MIVQTQCAGCGEVIEFEVEDRGQTINCPSCNQAVVLCLDDLLFACGEIIDGQLRVKLAVPHQQSANAALATIQNLLLLSGPVTGFDNTGYVPWLGFLGATLVRRQPRAKLALVQP